MSGVQLTLWTLCAVLLLLTINQTVFNTVLGLITLCARQTESGGTDRTQELPDCPTAPPGLG